MPAPTLNPYDLGSAHDLRAITPSNDDLNPAPRCIYVAAEGVLKWEAAGALPDMAVGAGQILLVRPRRILPGTTATIVALY